MQIRSAKLINFRNYKQLELDFSDRVNIFIGDNGQGKTNLLEAIYLLTSGQSFRDITDINTLKSNSDLDSKSLLLCNLTKETKEFMIKIILSEKKHIKVNDKLVQTKFLNAHFPTIVFSPDSLEIIKSGSEKRRLLIDQALTLKSENNATLLMDYKRALKTRNRILKDLKEEKQPLLVTMKLLEALHESFIPLAVDVSMSRIQYLKELEKDFNNAIQYILRDKNVDISVDYVISKENHKNSAKNQVTEAIQKRVKELLSAELSTGMTLVGPQRHDINFKFNQNDSRFYCSQGQQRAIILSFKVAQIMNYKKSFGFYPLLLLDDVLSELDMTKQSALISFLHEIKTQVFLTTTDVNLPHLFSMDPLKVFKIKEGQIV